MKAVMLRDVTNCIDNCLTNAHTLPQAVSRQYKLYHASPRQRIFSKFYNDLFSEGKSPLGRPRRRWEHNIKMDLQEVGCGGMD